MEPTRADRILEEWDAVSERAHRPAMSPRRSNVTSGRSGATLAGASLVVVALVVAVALLGRPGGIGDIGGLAPTPTPTAADDRAIGEPLGDAIAITLAVADRVPDAQPDPEPDPDRRPDRAVRSEQARRTDHGLGGRGWAPDRRRRADERRGRQVQDRDAGQAAARRRPRVCAHRRGGPGLVVIADARPR